MLTGLLTNLLWELLITRSSRRRLHRRDGHRPLSRRLVGASGLVSHPAKSRCQRRDYYACGNGRRCTAAPALFAQRQCGADLFVTLDALDGAKPGGVGGDYGDRLRTVDKILTAVIVWLYWCQLPIHHAPAARQWLPCAIIHLPPINTVGIDGLHHAYPARADHFADLRARRPFALLR